MSELNQTTLIYVNQIYMDEPTGQGSFERGLVEALVKTAASEPECAVQCYSIRKPGADSQKVRSGSITRLVLDKTRYRGYLCHQLALFRALAKGLRGHGGDQATLFVRYSPAMIAPLLISLLFRRRLVFRTGPVLASMRLYRPDLPRWIYWIVRPLLRSFVWRAYRIVVVTTRTKEALIQTFPTASEKIVVLPNAVDTSKFHPSHPQRERFGLPDSARTVLGFVGSMTSAQPLDVVLEAMSRIKNTSGEPPWLLALGDGPELHRYKELAEKLGVADHVVWAGPKPHEQMPAAICCCDLALLPLSRRTIEERGSSAMKLFEYLACDRFVLAARCSDLSFLEEQRVGQLVDAEDVDEWTAAIAALMGARRTQMNLNGRARSLAERTRTFDVLAKKIWTLCFS